jgi:hypothetical protein
MLQNDNVSKTDLTRTKSTTPLRMETNSTPSTGSNRSSLSQPYLGFGIVTLIAIAVAAWALLHLRKEAETRVVVTTQNLAVSLEKSVQGMIDTIDVAEQAAAYEIGRQISSGKPDSKAIADYLVMQTSSLSNVSFL